MAPSPPASPEAPAAPAAPGAQALWQRPRLRRDEEQHLDRRATWLEPFFDLVFVVVVAEVAHNLAGDVSWGGVAGFVLLFVPAWWIWLGATIYNDRFETDDLSHRLLTLLLMLPLAALAVNVHGALGSSSTEYVLSYAAARLVIVLLWFRAGWHNPEARPLTTRYVVAFSATVALWLASLAVPPPLRYVLWGVGLVIDLTVPVTTLRIQRGLPRLTTSHLPERYGLFTIIVLGEAVAGAIRGVAEGADAYALTAGTWLAGALGLALAFGLWAVYFGSVIGRPIRRSPYWILGWGYLHLPLMMALTVIGAGVAAGLAETESGAAHGAAYGVAVERLIAGGVALALALLGLIEMTLIPRGTGGGARRPEPAVRLAGAGLALGVTLLAPWLGLPALLALLLAACASQIAYTLSLRLQAESSAGGPK